MSSPRSIRFDPGVEKRLASFVARHPGLSSSSVAARLVDEGLRMDEHRGITFPDGPIGRRATLVGGPDVWEVIRAVQSARAAEPDLAKGDLLELVAENSGLPARLVRTAVAYWAEYPDDVESLIAHDARVQAQLTTSQERTATLLTP